MRKSKTLKNTALSVRLPRVLKREIVRQARAGHHSVTWWVVNELAQVVARKQQPSPT